VEREQQGVEKFLDRNREENTIVSETAMGALNAKKVKAKRRGVSVICIPYR